MWTKICLDDGSIVDIVLNPLGVPSRMNIDRSTRPSLTGRQRTRLNVRFPIFDGATLEEITDYTNKERSQIRKTYLVTEAIL